MQLWESLTASDAQGSLFCWTGEKFERNPWRDVVREAERYTGALRRLGVRSGSRVAAILVNTTDTARAVLGTWLAGGALASLPVPSRGLSLSEYGAQLIAVIRQLEPAALLVPDEMASLVPQELGKFVPVRTYSSLAEGGRVNPAPPGPHDLAFIQYSSGSTSTPKGCSLTTQAIEHQLDMIFGLTGERGRGLETYVSWLPLSHDMGFFGCFLHPWAYDFDLALSTPQRFMFTPRSWFRDMSEFQATVTAAPNTALHLAVRAQHDDELPRPLALRCGVIGAERVDWDTLCCAQETFRPYGLAPNSLTPAYGMAEATLAITACPHDELPTCLPVNAARLADGEVVDVDPDHPAAARIVSTGPPVQGVEVSAGDGRKLTEIEVRSPSLGEGYFGDPGRTASHFVDGTLRTGDLGFVRDGQLYVVARTDDILQVGGRSVYTKEVEAAIDGLEQVRKGCTVMVSAPNKRRDEVVLLTEINQRQDDYRELASRVATIATRTAGVDLAACLFLERGALPKTPSGKIQRFRARQLLMVGALQPIAQVRMAD